MRLLAYGACFSPPAWPDVLEAWGFEPRVLAAGEDLSQQAVDHASDVVVLASPGSLDGAQACHELRALANPPRVMVLGTLPEAAGLQACLQLGADDYMALPLDVGVLRARLTLLGRRAQASRHSQQKAHALRRQVRVLRAQSRTDALTNVGNRRALELALQDAWDATLDQREPTTLVLLDVDHFKAFNDSKGHVAGDAALRQVAQTLAGQLRRGDGCYRAGGEEFAVVLRRSSLMEAQAAVDRLCQAVAALGIAHPKSPLGVLTVSAGAAVAEAADQNVESWMARADDALYSAKRAGRNMGRVQRSSDTAARCAPDALACA
jgi:diguanylate cyclase (GGDEF)-like protein